MKKSIVMLATLFVLGACSAAPDDGFKNLVGGKTIAGVGSFSSDATTFNANGVELKYTDGSSNSGTYEKEVLSVKTTYIFTEVDANGGKYEIKLDGTTTVPSMSFTFS